jgi:hypothetical protein
MASGDDDTDDHQQERCDLADDRRRAAAKPDVQPEDTEGDGDHRVGGGDDGLDRRQVGALLEGVLVEYEAGRAYDRKDVDRPAGEHLGRPAAEFGRDELDHEGGDSVTDAAGQRQRERPQVLVPGRDGQATAQHYHEPDGQRRHDAEARLVLAAGGPPDRQKPGHAGRGSAHPREHNRCSRARSACVPVQGPADQDRENQVEYQDRLYQRDTAEVQRHDLQGESHDVRADSDQPQRLASQVGQDERRQRLPGLDPLGAALVRDRRYPEDQRGGQGRHHGDRRGHPLASRTARDR